MPLQRRIPKFGFKNNNKMYFKGVNLDALEQLAAKIKASEISVQTLVDNGIVGKYDKDLIKELNAALREGRYSNEIWKERTGKTLDDLAAEWKKGLEGPATTSS